MQQSRNLVFLVSLLFSMPEDPRECKPCCCRCCCDCYQAQNQLQAHFEQPAATKTVFCRRSKCRLIARGVDVQWKQSLIIVKKFGPFADSTNCNLGSGSNTCRIIRRPFWIYHSIVATVGGGLFGIRLFFHNCHQNTGTKI